ncbi:hypothetical protein, variant [Sphaeroforma arctica JP610]|uniref:Alpha-2-macroglobulin domain-containing protein n=1 Tax=Sphaeroforma arctica JP610 TaxID=667725 RepID=A0A0L0FYF3_9EUKA|nr:hypothetical protein, variant [Sphaeroforma arctica JP610]KNC80998.1 hypothetical protein, variant [Sphaeroforma arctica JP610]|eukprot:XP_014154900.1 hypothetical protein, variant [Sphaeroforma arctica JP610]
MQANAQALTVTQEFPLTVQQFLPSNTDTSVPYGLSDGQDITIMFSRPVIALGSDLVIGEEGEVAELPDDLVPMKFVCENGDQEAQECNIDGVMRWVTTSIARFTPIGGWPTDVKFTVVVPDDLTTFDGVVISAENDAELQRKYSTPSLRWTLKKVVSEQASEYTEGRWDSRVALNSRFHGDTAYEMPPDAYLEVTFSADARRLDTDVLLESIKVLCAQPTEGSTCDDSAGDGVEIDVELCSDADAQDDSNTNADEFQTACFKVIPKTGLKNDTDYQLTVAAGTVYNTNTLSTLSSDLSLYLVGLLPFQIPLDETRFATYTRYRMFLNHGLLNDASRDAIGASVKMVSNETGDDLNVTSSLPYRAVLEIAGDFAPYSSYKISIAQNEDIKDGFGQPLLATKPTWVNTSDLVGSVLYADDINSGTNSGINRFPQTDMMDQWSVFIMDKPGDNGLSCFTGEDKDEPLPRVVVAYILTEDNIETALTELLNARSQSNVMNYTEFGMTPDLVKELPAGDSYAVSEFEIELEPLLETGAVLVRYFTETRANYSTRPPTCAYAVTSRVISSTSTAVSVLGEEHNVLVWATDTTSGDNLSDLKVVLYPSAALAYSYDKETKIELLGEATTDATGVAVMPYPKTEGNSRLTVQAFVFDKDGKLAISNPVSASGSGAQPSLESVMVLDRGLYRQGETVHVKGYVRVQDPAKQTTSLPMQEAMNRLSAAQLQRSQIRRGMRSSGPFGQGMVMMQNHLRHINMRRQTVEPGPETVEEAPMDDEPSGDQPVEGESNAQPSGDDVDPDSTQDSDSTVSDPNSEVLPGTLDLPPSDGSGPTEPEIEPFPLPESMPDAVSSSEPGVNPAEFEPQSVVDALPGTDIETDHTTIPLDGEETVLGDEPMIIMPPMPSGGSGDGSDIPEGFQLRVTGSDGYNELYPVVVDEEFGTFDTTFDVADDAKQGSYNLYLIYSPGNSAAGVVGGSGAAMYTVADPRIPTAVLSLKAPQEVTRPGEKVKVTVSTALYTGGVIADAEVTINWQAALPLISRTEPSIVADQTVYSLGDTATFSFFNTFPRLSVLTVQWSNSVDNTDMKHDVIEVTQDDVDENGVTTVSFDVDEAYCANGCNVAVVLASHAGNADESTNENEDTDSTANGDARRSSHRIRRLADGVVVSPLYDGSLPETYHYISRIALERAPETRLNVDVHMSVSVAAPRDTVDVTVNVSDSAGNPVSKGDVMVAMVDKALLDLQPISPNASEAALYAMLYPTYFTIYDFEATTNGLGSPAGYARAREIMLRRWNTDPYLRLQWPIEGADYQLQLDDSDFFSLYYTALTNGGNVGPPQDSIDEIPREPIMMEMADGSNPELMLFASPAIEASNGAVTAVMDEGTAREPGAITLTASAPLPRGEFAVVPLWVGSAALSAEGVFTVSVDLPDNVGEFVVYSYVIGEGSAASVDSARRQADVAAPQAVGVGEASLTVVQPVATLQERMPRVLRAGDVFMGGVIVSATDEDFDGQLTVEVEVEALGDMSEAAINVCVPEDDSSAVPETSLTLDLKGQTPVQGAFRMCADALGDVQLIVTLKQGDAIIDSLIVEASVSGVMPLVTLATSAGVDQENANPYPEGIALPPSVPNSGLLSVSVGVGRLPAVVNMVNQLAASVWLSGNSSAIDPTVSALSLVAVPSAVSSATASYESLSDEVAMATETADLATERLSVYTNPNFGLTYMPTTTWTPTSTDVWLNAFALYAFKDLERDGNTRTWEDAMHGTFSHDRRVGVVSIYVSHTRYSTTKPGVVLKEYTYGGTPAVDSLDIYVKGTGEVQVVTLLQFIPLVLNTEPISRGVSVEKIIQRVNTTNGKPYGPSIGPDEIIEVGEIVQITLQIVAPDDMTNVAVVDGSAGGIEAQAFVTTISPLISRRRRQAFASIGISPISSGPSFTSYFWNPFEYREMGRFGVRYYASSLRAGTYTLAHTALCVTEGAFSLPPTHVYSEPQPDIMGLSAGAWLVTSESMKDVDPDRAITAAVNQRLQTAGADNENA